MTCGIYALKFNNTGKVYIGMSDNIERRWYSHKHSFLTKKCPAKLLEAYNIYGMPSLEVLCECDKHELDTLEKEAISIYDSIANGFNSRDGGATGAGLSISGEGNGRAKYSNTQIEEVFILLCNTDLTFQQISTQTGVSIEAISHVSCGSGHKWLATKYPEKYQELILSKRSSKLKFTSTIIVDKKTNIVYTVNSYKDIQDLTGCAYTTAVALVSGQLQTIFKRWCLKDKVNKPAKSLKNTYILENTSTNQAVEVYSKIKFFENYGLVNKKKFSDFLKAGIIGSEYQGWKLLSVS
jgi:hypothetical protein